MKTSFWPLFAVSGVSLSALAIGDGQNLHGFRLIEKRFIQEINAECLYLEHLETGAKALKIAAADANKTFCVAFSTPPDSSAGTPHILEHSVLCGSRNFPVKAPFVLLIKGSLATFINALTYKDRTAYPAASMNMKDYFNLSRVYLDAVFNPLIYDNPNIFPQEGWHYELTDKDAPLVRKGVVYNEMKGSYSSPTGELYKQTFKNLFPNNAYGYDSGGDPREIPSLTREKFLDFHRRYYHPSNAVFFLYGDAPLDKELALIDSRIAGRGKKEIKTAIPKQPPFAEMKTVNAEYAVPEGTATDDQSFLSFSWVIGDRADRRLEMVLDILAEALVRREAAPLRQALHEAGIGRDIQASVDDSAGQFVFRIVAKNASPKDKEKFRDIVLATLREVAKTGLDAEAVDGILNRMEFRLRENDDANKGLKYAFTTLGLWLSAGDPFSPLTYETDLAAVKETVRSGGLTRTIQTAFLNNPHAVFLALDPDPGLEKKRGEELAKELAAVKAKLSPAEIDALVKTTKDLIAEQKREDSPEAVASVPTLKREDLDVKPQWDDLVQSDIDGVPVLRYSAFTNNTLYLRFYYDMSGVPESLLPYAALLTELLGKLDTSQYPFAKLDNALNRYAGGFDASLNLFVEKNDDRRLTPKFLVSAKTLAANVDKTFALLDQIVNHTCFADRDRLKELLERVRSGLDAWTKNDGLGCARKRFGAYLTRRGVFSEITGGLTYYRFIEGLADRFDANAADTIAKLQQTAALIFSRKNLTVGVTCGDAEWSLCQKDLKTFIAAAPDIAAPRQNWELAPDAKNEGLLAASKVQYVVKGYDFKKLGYSWNGKLLVLSNILSRDWMWNRVRVVGGAYGGWAAMSPAGDCYFASYRDPNLKETLAAFDGSTEYLKALKLDEKEMTRYVIGTISGLDRPLPPSARGDRAFARHFAKTDREELQKERDEVLSIAPDDIKTFVPMFADILARGALCVYGDEARLRKDQDLFKALVPLEKENAEKQKK